MNVYELEGYDTLIHIHYIDIVYDKDKSSQSQLINTQNVPNAIDRRIDTAHALYHGWGTIPWLLVCVP